MYCLVERVFISSTFAEHICVMGGGGGRRKVLQENIPRQECRVKEQNVEQCKNIEQQGQCWTKMKENLQFSCIKW